MCCFVLGLHFLDAAPHFLSLFFFFYDGNKTTRQKQEGFQWRLLMCTFKPKLTEDCEGHVSPGTFELLNHQAEDTGQPNLRISLYLSHIGGFCVVTAAYTVQKTVQTSQYSEEKEKECK